jgi:ribosome recycling factor
MFDSKPFDNKFSQALEYFKDELKKFRTGRAHPDMLEGIIVEVYGTKMPLNQVATVLAPEATQILVTPFDASNIDAVSAAIRNEQSLQLNPSDDGHKIRIALPPLTEERRREIVKNLGEKVEDTRVAFRNIRQDALKLAKQMKDDKMLSEDDLKRIEKDIDDTVAKKQGELETLVKAKEAEVMKV